MSTPVHQRYCTRSAIPAIYSTVLYVSFLDARASSTVLLHTLTRTRCTYTCTCTSAIVLVPLFHFLSAKTQPKRTLSSSHYSHTSKDYCHSIAFFSSFLSRVLVTTVFNQSNQSF